MNLSDLIANVPNAEQHGGDVRVTGVANDSRNVQPGDVFVAVRGVVADGNRFIPQALERGAVAVVTDDAALSIDNAAVAVVSDATAALAEIAAAFYRYPARKLTMVGITGTNGKTTVAHLVRHLLAKTHKVGVIGTTGFAIGNKPLTYSDRTTPDALALQKLLAEMVKAKCTHCVMEVSSHALCMHRVDGILYAAAGFTNLQQDHLDYHETMDAYFAAKKSLFAQAKTAVVNVDDAYGRRLRDVLPQTLTFGLSNDNTPDLCALELVSDPKSVSFMLCGQAVRWNTPGRFSAENVLCALGLCQQLGEPLDALIETLKDIPPVLGRMETVPTDTPYTVMIDFAHTPDALENVLSTLKPLCKGRLWVLFGCGGDRDKTKRPLMGAAASKYADCMTVTSDNPRTESPDDILADIFPGLSGQFFIIEDRRDAIAQTLFLLRPDDVLVLCGKGHEMTQEINGEKFLFDERKIVKKAIRELSKA